MTTMTKRTDIHSPSNFKPESYSFLGLIYCGPSFADGEEINDATLLEIARQHAPAHHKWGHCDHCGVGFHYGAIFRHEGGEVIAVGGECATERFPLSNIGFIKKRLAARVAALRERGKAAAARKAFLAERPGLEEALKAPHHIVGDIDRKLTQYGSISDRQIEFVHKLAAECRKREEEKIAREAKLVNAPDLAEGRYEFEGEIATVKWQDSAFGGGYKMLVILPDGNKLWGTLPSSVEAADRGDRIKLTATVKRSGDDAHFGFFSRPVKAVITPATPTPAEA